MRTLLRLPAHLLQALALLALALVLLFFGLTRTEVGRDELRGQIERAFAAEYEGTVEIGRLTGTLVFDLTATDVRLRDAQGRVVIAADSVLLEPTWRGLLQRRLQLDEATLLRPQIALVRGEDGRWNLADALTPRHASTEPGTPLDPASGAFEFNAPSIRIVGGTLTTRNEGAFPAAVRSGTLFDYTNTRLTDLDADLEVDFNRERRRLRVRAFSASLPDLPLEVEALEGTLTLSDGRVNIQNLALRTEASRIEGTLRITSEEDEPHLALDLAPSRVSGDEVRRVVPAAPVADAVDLAGRVSGPLRDLTLDDVRIARGATDLRLSGTLAGLPDSAAFAVTIPRSTLRQADVAAVLPTLALPDLAGLGTVALDLDADGALRATPDGLRFRADSRFDLASEAGRSDGRLRLSHRPGAPLVYTLDATTAGLDPGRVLRDPSARGNLTGHIRLDGRGTTGTTLASTLRLDLGPSVFAGRTVDSLAVDVAAEGLRLSGTVAGSAGGRFRLTGTADLDAATYDLDLRTVSLDLRRLLDGAPPTDLTAEASFDGAGRSLDDLRGDLVVAFGPSTLGGEARPIPAHGVTLSLHPTASGSNRLDLDGDLVALRAEGFTAPGDLAALASQWTSAMIRTGRIETAKYYRAPPDSLRRAAAPLAPPSEAAPQAFTLHAEIRRPEALGALLPGLPRFAPGTALDGEVTLASDTLALALVARGDSLRVPGVRSGAFAGTLRLASGYGPNLAGRSRLDLTLVADTLQLPIGPLSDATAEVRLHGRTLDLAVQSARLGEAGRFALDAALALRPEVNRLTIHSLDVVTAGQTWATPSPQTVDFYADLIRLDRLAVERQNDPAPTPPRLAFRGMLSPLATDSLYVEASALDLDEVFSVLGLRDLFGGRLDAELAVAGVLRQPVVLGEAAIERFTFAGRRAGQITLASRFLPGFEGVAVDLHLMPDGDSLSVVNDLRATGTVRLPGTDASGARDPGALDLALDLDRVDLFVFDWLFPTVVADARGYATGTGRITGTPRVPLFDADLDVRDGAVRIPDFGLALTAEGRLRVDREGFHLRNVLLGDKSGGQGLVRGDILFNDYRFFSFDLDADLAEMEIVDVPDSRDLPFYGHIRATGSASLTGPLDNVFLHATDAQTTPDSEIFIPVTATGPASDAGFLVFADSLGNVPEVEARRSVIGERPEDERAFLEGLEMSLNVAAPPGSTVHLVFDPLIGDVINAVGSAQLQLAIREGEFQTFGTFDVERGDYLFTAGDVFTRRFELEGGGTLQWDGDPIDARLALPATYRTRASLAGLDLPGVDPRQRVPILITMDVSGRVTSPLVTLALALDETNRTVPGAEALRRQLNQSDRQAEYATSVLLTNSFLLAPSENPLALREAADELLFTSLSQLVSSRLNLFLNDALDSENVDVLFGVQQGVDPQDFDLTYGVALRLLDERLIIRGEGIYQRLDERPVSEELQGEVAVEVRLSPSVSLEVFYRREGDLLLGSGLSATPYGSYGAGVNYETQFANWRALLRRLLGDAARERDTTAAAPL